VKQASIVISPIGAIRDRFDLSPMDGCIICLLSRKEGTVKTWRYRRRSALREVAAWLAYLCDSSVFVDFYEVWAEKVHPVAAKLSGRPAKIINVYQPAGKMEEFFREVSTFKNLPTREDENLAMRFESGDVLEIGPVQDSFDFLQLEPQLPVKQDLLEGQELRLFVEPVAIRPVIGRLEQARFIVEMKRAHADARHRGYLFDCVCHRFLSAEITLVFQVLAILGHNVT